MRILTFSIGTRQGENVPIADPFSFPAKPLVSYLIYRNLSGWNPPPLVIRAFGAHCHLQTWSSSSSARS